MRTHIFTIILLLACHILFSQAPQGFNYQGVARDNTGAVLENQNISIKISILEGSASGTLIYDETHALTTNEFGLFSLVIGEGNTTSNFSNINWSNGSGKWLQIEMDATGGSSYTIIGSQKLISVPYALYAQNSGNGTSQWNSASGGIYYNSGNVGIGTTAPNPSAALDIQSNSQGFLPPVMTDQERDAISNPAIGLTIYNETTNCLNIYKPTGWYELCGNCLTLSAPNCTSNSPVCENATLYLYGNSAPSASYYWSGPNGFTSTDQNPVINNVSSAEAGTYSLYVDNGCGNSPVTNITVSIDPGPTIADAGTDQTGISGTSTTLAGNTPVVGTGLWSVISGSGGTITNASDPTSSFSGVINTSYELTWTISNNCGTSTDTVIIDFSMGTFTCGDSLLDTRDGQKYPTVLIGTQCWMAKNLNYGTYISGTLEQANNGYVEKYCYGDNLSNCDSLGGLYQWDEMMQYTSTAGSQGICPVGWHVPTDAEYKTLEMELGMSSANADIDNAWRGTDEGTQMKYGGTSGFDALLAGGRFSAGSFMGFTTYGYLYTSTETSGTAWRRCVNTTAQIGRWNTFPKSYALSVRCLKD